MEIELASKMKNYFPPVAQQPSVGQGLYRGFTITLRHTTVGRIPLDE